jgi:hypothetical protein
MTTSKKTAKTSKKARTAPNQASGATSLAAAVSSAMTALNGIVASLDAFDLASLTSEERTHSNGKLRDGETVAMTSVLDAIDARSGIFANLATKDHGTDDAVVETAPARAALARRTTMKPLGDLLNTIAGRVSDDLLAEGSTAKDVTVPAYALIQANAPIDPTLRRVAAPALSFYKKLSQPKTATKIAQGAARTAKAAAKAAAKVAAKGANGAASGAKS